MAFIKVSEPTLENIVFESDLSRHEFKKDPIKDNKRQN